MPDEITIRRQNQFVELSLDGKPLPASLARRCEAITTHTTLEFVRGRAARNADGNYSPVRTRKQLVHQYDDGGRFVCLRGYLPNLQSAIAREGFTFKVVDCNPPLARPDAFEIRLDRIFERMSLRYRQDEMVAAILSHEFGVVVAAPGFGKTATLAAIGLALPKARILITTVSLDVLGRIRDGLTHFFPSIGQVGGGKRELDCQVTLCSADSLHHISHDADEPDILLIDEVHEASADTYIEELAKFRRSRIFGLTATHNARPDKKDALLEGICGTAIFYMSVQEAEEHGLILPVRYKFLPVPMTFNPCDGLEQDVARKRHGIWRNRFRNEVIAQEAMTYDPDDQVLILVETVEHAVYLKQLLPDFTLNYDQCKDYEYYVGKGLIDRDKEPLMTTQRRRDQRRDFESGKLKKVISTVWDTGVDFTQLSVIFRACARTGEIIDTQAPGRTLRPHETSGKNYGLVVDLDDQFDKTFHGRSERRRRNYDRNGWKTLSVEDGSRFSPVSSGAVS